MKEKQDALTEVGVIVGRFQCPELHACHIDLIRYVVERHEQTIIFLGLSPIKATWNNPLDFESRKGMVLEKFPEVTVLYIKDQKSDIVWSNTLDEMIGDIIGPHHSATLYGGRDSFIEHYTGKRECLELESNRILSATEIRGKISKKVMHTSDFRAGVTWATQNRYQNVLPTVDMAILDGLNKTPSEILLGRKKNEEEYRYIGGFTDPRLDKCYEDAAKREIYEETNLEVTPPVYIGSAFIDDWRYRYEKEKIITLLFKCRKMFGIVEAKDDIVECRWFHLWDGVDDNKVLIPAKLPILKSHEILHAILIANLQKEMEVE